MIGGRNEAWLFAIGDHLTRKEPPMRLILAAVLGYVAYRWYTEQQEPYPPVDRAPPPPPREPAR